MKNFEKFSVAIICLFCGAPLQGPENANFSSGDLIKCSECDEENDYDGLIKVAKEKGVNKVRTTIKREVQKEFKKIFKKW